MKALGLDIGTTSICGVLLDGDTVRVAARPNTAFIDGGEGERLQDTAVILATLGDLRDELCGGTVPDTVGVSGMMHGILYLDENDRPLSPLITWQDGRGRPPL